MPGVNPNSKITLPGGTQASGTGGISSPHAAIIAVLIEVGGLAVVTMIAGVSEDMANLALLFMFGLFLLFIIMHSSQVSEFVGGLSTKELAAS